MGKDTQLALMNERVDGETLVDKVNRQTVTLGYRDLFARSFFRPFNYIVRGIGRDYWFKGGRGSTKTSFVTTFAGLDMVADAIKYKRGLIPRSALSHCAIFRKVSSDIRDSTFAHVQDSLSKIGVLPWFNVNHSNMTITFTPTGQHFKFHGCDDETKIKGFKNYKDPYILVLVRLL